MDVLGALRDGDAVKAVPVAKALAAPDGSFGLRVDPAVALDEYTEDDGTVNLTVLGATDTEVAALALSRQLVRGVWMEPGRGPGTAESASDVALSLTTGRSRSLDLPEAAPAPALDKSDPCFAVVATYDDRKGIVGELYTGPNATGDLKYQAGSSSTLGVGWSVSGAYGSFKPSGSATNSESAGINFAAQPANAKTVFQTSWRYQKFRVAEPSTPGPCYVYGYEVRPTLWWGGSYRYTAGSAPTATNCAGITAGDSPWKDKGTAITFTNGVDLKVGAVGVELSTSTGFNQNTKISFSFVNNGKLCGSNTSWPYAARVVGK
jgi:hypothetical protein